MRQRNIDAGDFFFFFFYREGRDAWRRSPRERNKKFSEIKTNKTTNETKKKTIVLFSCISSFSFSQQQQSFWFLFVVWFFPLKAERSITSSAIPTFFFFFFDVSILFQLLRVLKKTKNILEVKRSRDLSTLSLSLSLGGSSYFHAVHKNPHLIL